MCLLTISVKNARPEVVKLAKIAINSGFSILELERARTFERKVIETSEILENDFGGVGACSCSLNTCTPRRWVRYDSTCQSMVPPAGLEPGTSWFLAGHLNQLRHELATLIWSIVNHALIFCFSLPQCLMTTRKWYSPQSARVRCTMAVCRSKRNGATWVQTPFRRVSLPEISISAQVKKKTCNCLNDCFRWKYYTFFNLAAAYHTFDLLRVTCVKQSQFRNFKYKQC